MNYLRWLRKFLLINMVLTVVAVCGGR
jgi:hypothetical protein